MNAADLIIIRVIAAGIIYAVKTIISNRKNCKSCYGCTMACNKRK